MKVSDIIYIHYYHKNVINRLLVIIFLKCIFEYKLSIYINWKPKNKRYPLS